MNLKELSKKATFNESGQPYGISIIEYGEKITNLILNYYENRARRFNLSVERMKENYENDLNRVPDKYNNDEKKLFEELNIFDTQKNEHLNWIKKVLKTKSKVGEINKVAYELINELDYSLFHEISGFLNDEDYKSLRQQIMGDLAKIYDCEIKYIGAILRTIVLSTSEFNNKIEKKQKNKIN